MMSKNSEAETQKMNLAYVHLEPLKTDSTKINNAVVIVPSYLINKIYKEVLAKQKDEISSFGFQKDKIPLAYVEKNFKFNVLEHIKEFLLRYLVISFLYQELREKKVVFAGEPRLSKVILEPDKDAEFHFEFTPVENLKIEEWKYIVFKAPKRKNYRDIDKQASIFVKEEEQQHDNKENTLIEIGDWVCFDIYLVDKDQNPILDGFKENLWLKIGDEEPDISFQEIFINKKAGDKFYSNANCLQVYFDNQTSSNYMFEITIKDTLNKHYFSIEALKDHFKIKTKKGIHKKLIEVFSFRNDLSLHKAIVEELFELLFAKFKFEAPHPAVLRQEQIILDILQNNPDYPVYKLQKDFEERIELLATKQVKETIIIDSIANHENIKVNHSDIRNYLNLANRTRTKELIYFQHPIIKANEQDYPIPTEILKQACLREKTLNYIINNLIRE